MAYAYLNVQECLVQSLNQTAHGGDTLWVSTPEISVSLCEGA